MIPIKKIGIIAEGEYKEWYIVVENQSDDKDTSYIVAYWSKDSSEGYDEWYENYETMERNVNESFKVNWTSQDYKSRELTDKEKKSVEAMRQKFINKNK